MNIRKNKAKIKYREKKLKNLENLFLTSFSLLIFGIFNSIIFILNNYFLILNWITI